MRMFLEKYPIKEKYLSFTAHSNTHLKFTFCNKFIFFFFVLFCCFFFKNDF